MQDEGRPPRLQWLGDHLERERGLCTWCEVALHRFLHPTPYLPAEVLGPRWVEASAPGRALGSETAVDTGHRLGGEGSGPNRMKLLQAEAQRTNRVVGVEGEA